MTANPWEREVKRLFSRYTLEMVEGLGLCPYATRARLESQVRTEVVWDRAGCPDQGAARVAAWGSNLMVEIGFLLYPELPLGREDFDAFVRRLREALARHHAPHPVPMAVVAFHPEASPDTASATRLINFVRRTPDPTVQAIRLATLEALRRGEERGTICVGAGPVDLEALSAAAARVPLHQRIAETNLGTIRDLGVEHVRTLFDDIRRDRDATYARLRRDVGPPPTTS